MTKQVKHSSEPWHAVGLMVECEDDTQPDSAWCDPRAYSQGHHDPTRKIGEANAKRIAACVNACTGINPEAVHSLLALAVLVKEAQPSHWPALIERAREAVQIATSKKPPPRRSNRWSITPTAAELMDSENLELRRRQPKSAKRARPRA